MPDVLRFMSRCSALLIPLGEFRVYSDSELLVSELADELAHQMLRNVAAGLAIASGS